MSKLLTEWSPSASAIELIKLNGIADEQIAKSLAYLKKQAQLSDIDGYDDWNAFFIMFCIKAGSNSNTGKS